jgi:hypothetical protein
MDARNWQRAMDARNWRRAMDARNWRRAMDARNWRRAMDARGGTQVERATPSMMKTQHKVSSVSALPVVGVKAHHPSREFLEIFDERSPPSSRPYAHPSGSSFDENMLRRATIR